VGNLELGNLSTSGPITLATNITTTNDQNYNGQVTLGSGSNSLVSSAGNIILNGGLIAAPSSFANQQSLTITAANGSVAFNNTVGASNFDVSGNYVQYSNSYFQNPNIFNLNTVAQKIFIRANITTFGTQAYDGHVYIGDNGSNSRTRVLLSEDPSITFLRAVDDEIANTHNLVVQAISTVQNQVPTVSFNAAVGVTNPLASLTVKTGMQNFSGVLTDISPDPTTFAGNISVLSTINTAGNQTYTTNSMSLGDPLQPNTPQSFTTNGGVITFNLGAAAGNGVTAYAPITFNLNGGSLSGLSGASISYSVTGAPTPATSDLSIIREGITSGKLLNQIEVGRAMEYVYSDGRGSSGSVSVTSPDTDCPPEQNECLKVQTL
jgi:hypothetical protein